MSTLRQKMMSCQGSAPHAVAGFAAGVAAMDGGRPFGRGWRAIGPQGGEPGDQDGVVDAAFLAGLLDPLQDAVDHIGHGQQGVGDLGGHELQAVQEARQPVSPTWVTYSSFENPRNPLVP